MMLPPNIHNMKKTCLNLIPFLSLFLLVHAQKAEKITFENSIFQIYHTPAKLVHLHWKDDKGQKYKSFSKLEAELKSKGISPLMITNGGIYGKGETPCGLHIEDGKKLNNINLADQPGNFYLKPNGVFFITDGNPKILESKEYMKKNLTPTLALQSGPLLLQNGKIHSKFNKGSNSKLLRSGVGITKDGEVIFAISKSKVNFHHFTRLFIDLGCSDALFLDGVISKMQIEDHQNGKASTDFAAILAVYE